jgi:hypothetical protein
MIAIPNIYVVALWQFFISYGSKSSRPFVKFFFCHMVKIHHKRHCLKVFFVLLVHLKKKLMLGGFHFFNYAFEFCEEKMLVFKSNNPHKFIFVGFQILLFPIKILGNILANIPRK